MNSATAIGNSLERLNALSLELEHHAASEDWDAVEQHANTFETLCEQMLAIDLNLAPELAPLAQQFVAIEQRLRPLFESRHRSLEDDLSIQVNSSRLNNAYGR